MPTTLPDVPARPSPAGRTAARLAPSPDGLRERKKRARREALVEAAQTLVLQRGLDTVTVEDICAEVGVSPRTFFNYFPSKDDAVLGLEDLAVRPEVVATFVQGGPSGALLDDLEVVVADVLAQQVVTPERMARTLELVQREPHLVARHVAWVEGHRAELVEMFVARRAVRPFVPDPELLALVVMSLLRASTLEWQQRDRVGEPVDHLPGVVDQLRALLTDTRGPEPVG
nr:TetR/AcrR family transcriptional regulator [Cellulosimicrobium protaetiae]